MEQADLDKIVELLVKTRITHIKITFAQKRIPADGVIKLVRRCKWIRFTVRNMMDGFTNRYKMVRLVKWQNEMQNAIF